MYKIDMKINENASPWNVPFPERCKNLIDCLRKGIQVALLLYEQPDTSTFRYRGYNVSQITRNSDKWRSIYFFANELDLILNYVRKVSLVVLIRMRWTHKLDRFIYTAKQNNIPILFDIDDLVFDISYLPLVTNTLNVTFNNEIDYDFWFAYIGRIQHTAEKADGFISTNAYLGEMLQLKFHKPYGVIPNFLNEEQIMISNKCLNLKELRKYRTPFIIGYFSGTPSHINDFKSVYKELMLLLDEFPEMQLRVVGFMEFPPDMQQYIKKGRITFIPLVNFLELQRLIAEVDVNIVPLVENTFTNCKSELKFFEAAIVKTPTFAQPTYTYKCCITDNVNGFLCRYGEWYYKIKAFYLGEFDRENIVINAYEYAMVNYYGKRILEQIEQCYVMFSKERKR